MGHKAVKLNRSRQQDEDELFISKPSSRCSSLTEKQTDPFMLIWLDEKSNENTLDTLRTKTLFRQINNDLCLFFDNPNIFLHEIEKLHHENKKVLLVVSGSLAKMILSRTVDTIATIIIFCSNYNKYTELMSKYWNVIDICTDHEMLKSCIQCEIPSLKLNLFINQSFRSIRPLNSSKDSHETNAAQFSYLLFIELLKQMSQTKQAKEIMLNKCKDYYRHDKKELKKIDLFNSTYTADKAIDWYTEDCFVYRLVNQAFRTEDITLWYLFRFFIIDLCTQLENVHRKQNIQDYLTLYRGQARMPTQDLENIRSNIGSCILTNGYLSTSKQINVARQFILDAENNDDFKVVMFEINVNASQLKSVIFVDIDQYQGRNEEHEILFNIGSVFKIQNVEFDFELNIWKIQMEATDECIDEIERRIDTMRKKFQNGNINLLFGRLLIDMYQYTKAESYFQMMLKGLPKDHEDLASVYDHIGDVNMRMNNWNEAYRNFSLAYDIKKIRLRSNHPSLGVTLNSIGNYHQAIEEHAEALNCYLKALRCNNDQHNAAITKLNIGNIYMINGQFDDAIKLTIEARDILQQIEPCAQIELMHCQGILGDIYFAQKDYVAAEHFYLTVFELSKKYVFIGARERKNCVKALVHLYEEKDNNHKAINFCLEQITLHEQLLGENHSSIAHLLMKVGELYINDDQKKFQVLKRALHIFEKNVHLEYATTATCLMMVAKCYVQQNQHDKASMCYMRALEIQQKIYPPNHPMIIGTQILIDAQESKAN
ncbi:unnamed protein product [Rotaria sp. Silwood2]|nr:unnamed protein product [Rotaria sp. Silwood2]CAF4138985.1 unnamed protein product [Rotaria sp. Silwood2]